MVLQPVTVSVSGQAVVGASVAGWSSSALAAKRTGADGNSEAYERRLQKLRESYWRNNAAEKDQIVIGKRADIAKYNRQPGDSILNAKQVPNQNWNWELNRTWLDSAIENGKPIKVVTEFNDVSELDGVYRDEITYLQAKGFELRQVGDEWFMVKK